MASIDPKKVLDGLRACQGRKPESCKAGHCEYMGYGQQCVATLARDAVRLIRERRLVQDPVPPIYEGMQSYLCGECGYYLNKIWLVCPVCGKPIKWEVTADGGTMQRLPATDYNMSWRL